MEVELLAIAWMLLGGKGGGRMGGVGAAHAQKIMEKLIFCFLHLVLFETFLAERH